MKKLILLFMVASFISCDTKTIEVQKSGGVWHMGGDDQFQEGTSPKAVIGSESDLEIAMAFYSAYGEMELDKMVELSEDIVKFHPGDVAGVFDVDMTNTDFIVDRQKDMDSVSRHYIFIMPLKMEGTNVRFVETSFNETTYLKDGSSKSVGVYEKLYINTDNKISRVVQWHRPSN